MVFSELTKAKQSADDMTSEEWRAIKYQLMAVGLNQKLVFSPYCPRSDLEAGLCAILQGDQYEQKGKPNQLPQMVELFCLSFATKG